MSMTFEGRVQPRYEYERNPAEGNHSTFFLRRLRVDLRGHVYSPELTYRIMPEWSRTAGLRDGWANYRLHDAAQIRIGQYHPLFAWERDSSSIRHLFVERSSANNEFQWNDGRDLGVMLHGELSEQVRYAVGVFGGEGREVRRTRSDGNLYTARLTYTPIGAYPRTEALVTPVDGLNLAFGLGAGYNTKNTPRDDAWQDANVFGSTADAHLQINRWSVHSMGFYRDVDPRDGLPSYDGSGLTLQAGYLFVPDLLLGSLRYSYSEPNTEQDFGKVREVIVGFQLYHFGHGSKVHIEGGRIERHDGTDWVETDGIRVQYLLVL